MSDFDIASLKNASTYAANLQKRKAMGLIDSDSEDETPKKKTTKSPPSKPKTPPMDIKVQTKSTEVPERDDHSDKLQRNISTTDEYIAAAEALMAQPIEKAKLEQPQKKTIKTNYSSQVDDLIELSDEEEIEEEIAIAETDIDDLDPELAALLKESSSSDSTQPLKVTVRLHYVHNLEVASDRAKEILQNLMKPVKVILMDNEQFRKVLDSYCAKKKLKSSDVVLTYNGDQIFLSGTPAGLGMNDIQIYNMHVYATQSYHAMLEQKQQQKLERLKRYTTKEEKEEEEEVVLAAPPVEEVETEKIILKLRGKDKKDIILRVRPTSTLSSILNSYKQHAGVTGKVNLSFEGEILDLNQTIEETDIEDEDLIEVV